MKNQSVYIYLLGVALLFWAGHTEGASSPKTTELDRKISEISSLQLILSDQISIAVKTQDLLQKQIGELAGEIIRERDKQQITSYPAAVKHPRINYNIKLIQRLSGYIAGLNAREQYFRKGNETLAFLWQQINDDLQLIRTLNDMQVDELINKINNVLDEYIPETKRPLITVNKIQENSSKKIWDEIIKQDQQISELAN